MNTTFVLKGLLLDTPEIGALRVVDGYAVCENGRCAGVFDALPGRFSALPLHDFSGSLILPGITDLHLHAPQHGFLATSMDHELLEWLERCTFPEESRFADAGHAATRYTAFVQALKTSVTTRAAVFGTLHTQATLELMRLLHASGLGAFVGKVNMDRNSPAHYVEPSAEAGEAETRRWLDACRAQAFPRVHPILTPRFTPSVSDDYMRRLGALAAAHNLPVQSHLNENPAEVDWVRSLCPDAAHYADTYDRFGLFGGKSKTIMAHCIYCTEAENRLLRERGVFIAHCPTSNENLSSGIAPAARYLREGFEIGLGSDVAGGHTLDLLAVMRSAVQVSKLHWRYIDPDQKPLTLPEALYMATVGGGRFFGQVGRFERDYAFDAVVLDDGALHEPGAFSPAARLERCAYLGGAQVAAKYVDGVRIL